VSDSEAPDSPLTELDAEAIRLHEIYISYINAGFCEPRAFNLACLILSHHLEEG
jgi:hypothetical protein